MCMKHMNPLDCAIEEVSVPKLDVVSDASVSISLR